MPNQRKHIQVRGIVQGVGFRPYVFKLAEASSLGGFVFNSSAGVTIEIEGVSAALHNFLAELRAREVPLYALTNWSSETYPAALKHFEFMKWFRGALVSGDVKMLKPDTRIFELFLETFAIDPAHAVYIDDRRPNVEAAIALGMHGIVFTDPPALRAELARVGLIPLG